MIELREYVSVDKGLVVDYVSNFNKFKPCVEKITARAAF